MIIVIPFCHNDVVQACRLMKWIYFLSVKDKYSMKKERVLMVGTPLAINRTLAKEMFSVAVKAFGMAHLHATNGDDQRGWPYGPNFMLRESIQHLDKNFKDDFLWLEPDAVPLRPDWFRDLKKEYHKAGKPFMGEYVTAYGSRPHMSGVGIYSKHWLRLAPMLLDDPNDAFDNWSAPQVLPHFEPTALIQHIFYNPIVTRALVRPWAAIFHQDKRGSLIKILDKELFSGEMYQGKDDIVQDTPVEPRFYHAENSNRVIKSGGRNFIFDPYGMEAGTWRGVYMTDKDDEIVALNAVVSNPASAVTEISQAEYEAKKKVRVPSSRLSVESREPVNLLLKPSPAVLVENPSPLPKAETVPDALQIEQVTPAVQPPAPPPVKRRRKAE